MGAEGWFRDLNDGRLEIFLKKGGRKLRASGPEEEMYELAEWFEQHAGATVYGTVQRWRMERRGPRPIPGQLALGQATGTEPSSLYDVLSEPSSHDATVERDG